MSQRVRAKRGPMINSATCGGNENPGCRYAHPGYACYGHTRATSISAMPSAATFQTSERTRNTPKA
jgi:hypothetical protein